MPKEFSLSDIDSDYVDHCREKCGPGENCEECADGEPVMVEPATYCTEYHYLCEQHFIESVQHDSDYEEMSHGHGMYIRCSWGWREDFHSDG